MKRLFDVVVAGVLLFAVSPLLVGVALLVRLLDGSPVLFRQARGGRGGVPFDMVKFRTMSTESEDPATDAARITRLGGILRATSLDELPTLVNVVLGHMSLVGPRPLPVRYTDRYNARQLRRLEVRPGVTGLAQVRGRNRLSWEERFELDVEYVDSRSFMADLSLLSETARSVLRRDGVEAEETVTMPEFFGTTAEELDRTDG